MRPAKIVMIVLGVLAVVLGTGLAAVGAPMVWVHAALRDGTGYYMSSTERLTTEGYAITSESVHLSADVDWADLTDMFGTIKITAEPADGGAVFVGIAPTEDVRDYLAGTSYDVVTEFREPDGTTYRRHEGAGAPGAPADQTFWAASANGPGRQTMTWDVTGGDWTLVVMNANATSGVAVDTSAGFRTAALLPLGLGLLIGGIAVLAIGITLVVLGAVGNDAARPRPPATTAAGGTGPGTGDGTDVVRAGGTVYPVRVEAGLEPGLSRWLWLVKWLLVIPHAIVLAFLWLAFFVLTVAAGVTILVTGRYPRAIFDFNVGVLRWQWRVAYYALTLGTDRYPPFSLRPDPAYPADLTIEYPDRLSRPLVLVKSWLLVLPHAVVVAVFGALTWWPLWGIGATDDSRFAGGIGLAGLLALVAGAVLLFTGRYPVPVFDFILGMQRWTLRVAAYAALMRDEYPPFRLDQGGAEPSPSPAEPPPPPPSPTGGTVPTAPPEQAPAGDVVAGGRR